MNHWSGVPLMEVLYEDNHLLAVNKPAQLPTMGVAADKESLLVRAKAYIKSRYHKPGNVYLGVVSRLDAPVTGVVLLARTSKAAGRLNLQFRSRDVEKTYWAVVTGHVKPRVGRRVDWLRKDERHRMVRICPENQTDAQEARLSYRVLRELGTLDLLEIQLETGRKHQIRVQLANMGHPVVGDRKYGSQRKFAKKHHGIALHALRLVVEHPVKHTPLELTAPLPPDWATLGVRGEDMPRST